MTPPQKNAGSGAVYPQGLPSTRSLNEAFQRTVQPIRQLQGKRGGGGTGGTQTPNSKLNPALLPVQEETGASEGETRDGGSHEMPVRPPEPPTKGTEAIDQAMDTQSERSNIGRLPTPARSPRGVPYHSQDESTLHATSVELAAATAEAAGRAALEAHSLAMARRQSPTKPDASCEASAGAKEEAPQQPQPPAPSPSSSDSPQHPSSSEVATADRLAEGAAAAAEGEGPQQQQQQQQQHLSEPPLLATPCSSSDSNNNNSMPNNSNNNNNDNNDNNSKENEASGDTGAIQDQAIDLQSPLPEARGPPQPGAGLDGGRSISMTDLVGNEEDPSAHGFPPPLQFGEWPWFAPGSADRRASLDPLDLGSVARVSPGAQSQGPSTANSNSVNNSNNNCSGNVAGGSNNNSSGNAAGNNSGSNNSNVGSQNFGNSYYGSSSTNFNSGFGGHLPRLSTTPTMPSTTPLTAVGSSSGLMGGAERSIRLSQNLLSSDFQDPDMHRSQAELVSILQEVSRLAAQMQRTEEFERSRWQEEMRLQRSEYQNLEEFASHLQGEQFRHERVVAELRANLEKAESRCNMYEGSISTLIPQLRRAQAAAQITTEPYPPESAREPNTQSQSYLAHVQPASARERRRLFSGSSHDQLHQERRSHHGRSVDSESHSRHDRETRSAGDKPRDDHFAEEMHSFYRQALRLKDSELQETRLRLERVEESLRELSKDSPKLRSKSEEKEIERLKSMLNQSEESAVSMREQFSVAIDEVRVQLQEKDEQLRLRNSQLMRRTSQVTDYSATPRASVREEPSESQASRSASQLDALPEDFVSGPGLGAVFPELDLEALDCVRNLTDEISKYGEAAHPTKKSGDLQLDWSPQRGLEKSSGDATKTLLGRSAPSPSTASKTWEKELGQLGKAIEPGTFLPASSTSASLFAASKNGAALDANTFPTRRIEDHPPNRAVRQRPEAKSNRKRGSVDGASAGNNTPRSTVAVTPGMSEVCESARLRNLPIQQQQEQQQQQQQVSTRELALEPRKRRAPGSGSSSQASSRESSSKVSVLAIGATPAKPPLEPAPAPLVGTGAGEDAAKLDERPSRQSESSWYSQHLPPSRSRSQSPSEACCQSLSQVQPPSQQAPSHSPPSPSQPAPAAPAPAAPTTTSEFGEFSEFRDVPNQAPGSSSSSSSKAPSRRPSRPSVSSRLSLLPAPTSPEESAISWLAEGLHVQDAIEALNNLQRTERPSLSNSSRVHRRFSGTSSHCEVPSPAGTRDRAGC